MSLLFTPSSRLRWFSVMAVGLGSASAALANPPPSPEQGVAAWLATLQRPSDLGTVASDSQPSVASQPQEATTGAPLLLAQASAATTPEPIAPDTAAPAADQPAAGEIAPGTERRRPLPWAYETLPQPFPRDNQRDDRVQVLVGVAANTSPDFFGGAQYHFALKPVAALQWGRWRFSVGGGYGLMGQGRRDRGSGAQAVLRETDRFNLSLSLNIDRGRDVAETDRLRGVPDVPATLRARLRARYYLSDRWTAVLAASQDILGKGRGMEMDAWLGYRWPVSEATRVDFGMGASWGNSQFMRSQYGVPVSATVASGYPAFRPGAGLYQTDIGVDVAHALSRSWVLFGGLHYSQLHGDARRSPLTLRANGVSATIGIAWRN
ncbi:MipA/OmpV family protein [Ottowia sp.]|uniref:MipA/OmpV family protein n=1 Tax=Ottowia sp. TaxID=1898956 RepID=UPI002CA1D066|nr:MipA/OmpV family protein [Ottowia sp.]HOB65895.1 MipA/OmpV family protein [Ottowia sp.]HPZ56878.1 MipA/OmpV family protein [Ottowia sp.]HQD47762.1 MipA/OmpV family protein [Ottowia sp.]